MLILPDLPEPFIIGMTELKLLGILPDDWPNIENLISDDYTPQPPSPMCEEERITNALLYAEGRDTMGDDTLGEHAPDAEGASPTTDPRCAIPDAHFNVDTKIDMIPGFDTWLDGRTKSVLKDFPDVFQKILSKKHHTAFQPVEFTLKPNFPPPPPGTRMPSYPPTLEGRVR